MFSNTNLYSNNTPKKSPHLNGHFTDLPQTNSPQKNLLLPITSNYLKNNNINSGIPNSNSQHPTKLNAYMEPETKLGIPSKMITLISLNEGSLHFHDEAANVFQRYQNNDIAFVGIWGCQNSDKSFFYDRLLYLADVDGEKYLNASTGNSNSLIYFYERPFIKDKIRFFLLDSKGYRNPNSLTKVQRNTLDLLISVCQVIILIQSTQNTIQKTDIVEDGYNHINQSFRRLYIDKKKKQQALSEICWPKSLFLLYNTSQSIKKHKNSQQTEQQLCRMFKDYNFSILHNKNNKINSQQQIKSYTSIIDPLDQLYLKNSSIIFKQIYDKIQGKNYMNIKFNGFTCPHIMNQTVYTLNQHENLYLPKSFNKAKKSVFSSMYNRYALAYLLKMKEYIGEQKPYSTDYLLKAFQNVSEQTMQQYHQTQNQITLRPAQDSICLQYERKLQEYIQQKQKNIIAVNNKKSAKQLKNMLAANSDPYQQLKKIQKSLLQNNRNFDQNAESLFVGNSIKQILASGIRIPAATMANNKVIEQTIYHELQAQKQKQQISKKQQEYIKKKVELQLLSSAQKVQNQQLTQQINRFKNEEMLLQKEITNQQKRLTQLKSKAAQARESSNSRNSSDVLIERTKQRIQQLRKVLLTERRQVQQMLNTDKIKDPELEKLEKRVIQKRLQLELVKKSGLKAVEIGPPKAERRFISAHDANIRRVHGSRI